MRILMVLDHPYPSDLRVENEARTLVAAGHDVTLLQIAPDDRPAADSHQGTRVVRRRLAKRAVDWLRGFAGVTPVPDWIYARMIRQAFAERPFDAIHAHDLYLVGGALRAGRQLGVPVVADLHENWVEALRGYAWSTRYPRKLVVRIPTWYRVERTWVQAADRLVVPIEEAADRYARLGVDPDRIAVVPNTVDLASFDAYPLDPAVEAAVAGPFTLVYTGNIDAHRGIDTAIEAMPAILAAAPEARLIVVGSGPTVPEHQARVADLGLDAAVTFVGRVPQPAVKSYLAAASVALVPHKKTPHTDHTIPHKLFHAMRVATPVLASNCVPLERIVEAEACGAVFESGDPASFARQALSVRDPGDRAAMGERGRQAVAERYHWDATAGPLVALYADLT